MERGGSLSIVGIGPGAPGWLTVGAQAILDRVSAVYGYRRYIDQTQAILGSTRMGKAWHASDNREEVSRAEAALEAAGRGTDVAIVSGGDVGIFGMAAVVVQTLAERGAAHDDVTIHIEPGVSAFQAAAARFGAPLGDDFCVLSLSTWFRPWGEIERRLSLVAHAGLALALYNPASRSRRWPIVRALEILAAIRGPSAPIGICRHLGRIGEQVYLARLESVDSSCIDMNTVLILPAPGAEIVCGRLLVSRRRPSANRVSSQAIDSGGGTPSAATGTPTSLGDQDLDC